MIGRDRVAYRAIGGVFVRTPHGKFVAIRFSEDNRAGAFEARDSSCVIRGPVALQDARTASCWDAARADDVFHRHRYASQRRERVTCGDGGVNPIRLGVRALGRESEKNVKFGVALLDPRVKLLHHLARRDFPCIQSRADRGNRPSGRGAHFSITRGTRK